MRPAAVIEDVRQVAVERENEIHGERVTAAVPDRASARRYTSR